MGKLLATSLRSALASSRNRRVTSPANGVARVTGNCLKAWEVLDDLFPDIRFDLQCANPPFRAQKLKPADVDRLSRIATVTRSR